MKGAPFSPDDDKMLCLLRERGMKFTEIVAEGYIKGRSAVSLANRYSYLKGVPTTRHRPNGHTQAVPLPADVTWLRNAIIANRNHVAALHRFYANREAKMRRAG